MILSLYFSVTVSASYESKIVTEVFSSIQLIIQWNYFGKFFLLCCHPKIYISLKSSTTNFQDCIGIFNNLDVYNTNFMLLILSFLPFIHIQFCLLYVYLCALIHLIFIFFLFFGSLSEWEWFEIDFVMVCWT